MESSNSDPQQSSVSLRSGDWPCSFHPAALSFQMKPSGSPWLFVSDAVCAYLTQCLVDAHGLHGLVCKQTSSRTVRHHAMNDVTARSCTSAGSPVTKEPVDLTRLDGKTQNGLTLAAHWPTHSSVLRHAPPN